MIDWRTADQVRIVQGKRREISVLDAQIAEAERDLATAQSFEGEFSQRLADVERRIGAASNGYSLNAGLVRKAEGEPGDRDRLIDERSGIENERDAQIRAHTVTSADGAGFALSYCPLRTMDVRRRLHHLGAVRGRVAQELADLEGTLSAGELVQSGVPAADVARRGDVWATAQAHDRLEGARRALARADGWLVGILLRRPA